VPVDTTVDGDPESVRVAARWLAGSLQAEVRAVADDLGRVRAAAGTAWVGQAGAAFARRMGAGVPKAGGLAEAAGRAGSALTQCADELARIQQFMAGVRVEAASAGLVVAGAVVQEPVRPPGVPATVARTPAEVAAHDRAVAAVGEYDRLAAAYARAVQDHEQGRAALKLLVDTLKNVLGDLTSKWFFTLGDLAGAGAQALAAAHVSVLSRESRRLAADGAKALERFRTAPAGTPARLLYDDWDSAARLSSRSATLAESAGRVETTAGKLAFRAGAGLAVAGVVYDIHNGKPVEQAVVSGTAGFGASLAAGAATGAAIGTIVPIPVAGTVAGAVVGAAAGLFVSGAVDSMYQNGALSVRQAWAGGTKALEDTENVIGDLGKDVWHAIF
jgi:uncharacterized protein YukE